MRRASHNVNDDEPVRTSEKNSRTIARWLIQNGWSHRETPTEFRLYPPDSPPPPAIVDSEDEPPLAIDDAEYGSIRLEAELRNFLANSLSLARRSSGTDHMFDYTAMGLPLSLLAIGFRHVLWFNEMSQFADSDKKAFGQSPSKTLRHS
jgi:hypothetical protein